MTINDFANKLKNEKSVAVICHIRPDGDCVGSVLALTKALNNQGIKAQAYCDDYVPERFFYLSGAEKISKSLEGEFTALVAVDCADLGRLGEMGLAFSNHKNTYNIDHHISNVRFAKNNVVIDSGANCENIYNLIESMGATIDSDIANALGTGLVTDTGNFRHKSVTPQTFNIASKLLEKGADFNKIVYINFSLQSKERALLFGRTMSKIRYFLDGKFAVATVKQSDFVETNARQDETEGFIDFVMGIKGVEVGACIMETEKDIYRISLRSLSSNVNAVASAFGGGGHILASGCKVSGDYEEIVDRLRFEVSKEIRE